MCGSAIHTPSSSDEPRSKLLERRPGSQRALLMPS